MTTTNGKPDQAPTRIIKPSLVYLRAGPQLVIGYPGGASDVIELTLRQLHCIALDAVRLSLQNSPSDAYAAMWEGNFWDDGRAGKPKV